ncbi:LOW QUALITY PROTEIN: Serine/threonine protein kinase [Phytophthora megakarya]|uniref:Serine/threonine protein kinase n=1 Tax=Phytophthora megakarya TaxID=4795 RepID=A0A225VUG0_9STRA|nr:LOW QUALITY PROTEIN: Serine/threonine protein kinase [Phytophthora megakarya]
MSNIVCIMNRHTGMVLEQNLTNNLVQAFDSGLDHPTHQWFRIPKGGGYFVYKNQREMCLITAFDSELDHPTHQWFRIPKGGGYFVYKNVATGNVLDHWDLKEGAGNTVARSSDENDPNHQWFEVKLGDIFIGLRNRASRLFIDHFGSREIRTWAEDCSYLERRWCLIWHHSLGTSQNVVTVKNVETGKFLEHTGKIQGVEPQVKSTSQQWDRIPVGNEGYFIYKNIETQKVLTLGQQGVDATDTNDDDNTQQWRECSVGGGLVALQNRAASTGSTVPQRKIRSDGESWIIHPNEITCQSKAIAEGSFGYVYRAKWARIDVVLKEVKVLSSMLEFQKEAALWSTLQHDNIVRFFGANFTSEPFFIVSKFAENGTLNEYISKVKASPKLVWQLMLQVAVGLAYLHSKRIIHGDLRGNNIMVSEHGVAMLTDFGFSFLDDGSCSVLAARDHFGALQWRAPEFAINLGERPTFASDIFSFGMCIIAAVKGISMELGMCIIAAVKGSEYPCGYDSNEVRKFYTERKIPVKKPRAMTEEQ